MDMLLCQITEDFIPPLEVKQVHMLDAVRRGYSKEVLIQSRYNGIRNPAGVLHNKIRHELTNDDKVRDAVTYALTCGLIDLYRACEIRSMLIEEMYTFVERVIERFPQVIRLEGAIVTRRQITLYNESWGVREIERVDAEETQVGRQYVA